MAEIGARIYWDKATGNVILNTGHKSGPLAETTIEQDFATFKELAERVPETVGIIQLEYGQYAQDFTESIGIKVDVSGEMPTLVFSYPDPTDPGAPPVYRKPLSQDVDELKAQNAEIILTLVMNDLM